FRKDHTPSGRRSQLLQAGADLLKVVDILGIERARTTSPKASCTGRIKIRIYGNEVECDRAVRDLPQQGLKRRIIDGVCKTCSRQRTRTFLEWNADMHAVRENDDALSTRYRLKLGQGASHSAVEVRA